MIYIKSLVLIYLISIVSSTTYAATNAQSNISESGKVGLSFLTIAPSARISSLGGISCAHMTGASSLWSNPSLIAFEPDKSFQFSHIDMIAGITQEFAAFSSALEYGTLGLGVQLMDSGDIDSRSDSGEDIGSFSINNVALSVGYAMKVTDRIAGGLTYKKLFEKNAQETAGGYALDGGVTVRTPLAGLFVAAAARNYGRMGKLNNVRTKLPSNLSFGCLYRDIIPGIERSHAALADIVIPKYGDNGVRLGIEIEVVDFFVLRLGYRNDSEFEDFSFGLGYSWEMISADFSYSPMDYISEDAMRFTLSITGF